VNFAIAPGVAVREWTTDAGPADYVLFVDKKAVGVIEAKRESEGQHLTVHETQTEGYAAALPLRSHRHRHLLHRHPRPQATALAHQVTLITHNTREFSRVPGLRLEDWEFE